MKKGKNEEILLAALNNCRVLRSKTVKDMEMKPFAKQSKYMIRFFQNTLEVEKL